MNKICRVLIMMSGKKKKHVMRKWGYKMMRENTEILDEVARAGAHGFRMEGSEGNMQMCGKENSRKRN